MKSLFSRESRERKYRRSFIYLVPKVLKKEKGALVGISILIIYIIFAIIAPFIPSSLLRPNIRERDQGPSLKHPLGTDWAGRDNLLMIIRGTPEVLLVAFLSVIITILVALTVGLVAGYTGGKTDIILMSLADVALTIPAFPLIYVLSFFLKDAMKNPFIMACILSITSWAGLSRAIRSQVLSLKESEFVEASRILGLGTFYIIFREILPCMTPYIVANGLLAAVHAIYAQIGLYFLGVLPFSPYNWGLMLNLAFGEKGALYGLTTGRICQLLAPIIAICLLEVGLTLTSSGLEKLLNPRLREE